MPLTLGGRAACDLLFVVAVAVRYLRRYATPNAINVCARQRVFAGCACLMLLVSYRPLALVRARPYCVKENKRKAHNKMQENVGFSGSGGASRRCA